MTKSVFSAELTGSALAAAAGRAAAVAGEKSKIPILQHALLEGGGKILTVSATNLDQGLALDTEGTAKGATTVSAARLAAVAQRLKPENKVKLSATDSTLTITQGRSTHKLPTLPAEDFPGGLTDPVDGAEWQADAGLLVARLKAVEGATNPADVSRPMLGGIHLDPGGEDTPPFVVATDGYRMAAIRIDDMAPPPHGGVILPVGLLRPLSDLAKGREHLDLRLSDRAVSISADGIRLRTKLIDSEYVDWRRVVPNERASRITVAREAFRRAAENVGIVEGDPEAKGKQRVTRLKMEIGEKEIVLSSRNNFGEEATDVCACKRTKGDDRTVGMNAQYLIWAIASLDDAKDLDIAVEDAATPIVITPKGDDDRANMRLIMPMRV